MSLLPTSAAIAVVFDLREAAALMSSLAVLGPSVSDSAASAMRKLAEALGAGERHDRWCGSRPLGIGDDGGLATLQDGHDRVRRPEVDAYGSCHWCYLRRRLVFLLSESRSSIPCRRLLSTSA